MLGARLFTQTKYTRIHTYTYTGKALARALAKVVVRSASLLVAAVTWPVLHKIIARVGA